jgi:hypothetical protein
MERVVRPPPGGIVQGAEECAAEGILKKIIFCREQTSEYLAKQKEFKKYV